MLLTVNRADLLTGMALQFYLKQMTFHSECECIQTLETCILNTHQFLKTCQNQYSYDPTQDEIPSNSVCFSVFLKLLYSAST